MLLLQPCALCRFHLTDGQNTRDKSTRGRRLIHTWSNCILCITFILSGSPNEYWLQTCDACTVRTWAGLFKDGFRWPRVSAKVEFRYKSLKSLIPFTSFLSTSWWLDTLKNNRENYLKIFCLNKKKKKPGLPCTLGANWPSNNKAQLFQRGLVLTQG